MSSVGHPDEFITGNMAKCIGALSGVGVMCDGDNYLLIFSVHLRICPRMYWTFLSSSLSLVASFAPQMRRYRGGALIRWCVGASYFLSRLVST